MGKWCLHASSFIFDQIVIKVAGNQGTGIKARMSLISGLWFPWPIYMFFEMRFDLGTLDTGERSLPFGLFVFHFPTHHFCEPVSVELTFTRSTLITGLKHAVSSYFGIVWVLFYNI